MEVHDVLNVFVFGKKRIEFMFIDFFSYFSIVRAFLIEEQRIVAMVMKSKKPTEAVPTTTTTQQTGQKSK